MDSTKRSTRKGVALAVTVLGAVILLVYWYSWWTRPPQMGVDAEVFSTVDALFTAVTARNEKLLEQCAERLQTLKAVDKLPKDAADHLADVIRKARNDRWDTAAQSLYAFMKAQRREGPRHRRGSKVLDART